jgi:hypothetical protein
MTCDQQRFERDIAQHHMTIFRDEGTDRHISFRQSGNSAYWFEILTWPGALCIRGDMGTYVFSRTPDMFQFFRTGDRGDPSKLYINEGYWTEKLIAVDCNGYGKGSAQEFSADVFKRKVIRRFREYCRDYEVEHDERKRMWYWIRSDILDYASDGDSSALNKVHEFSDSAHPRIFDDFWEVNCDVYTFHLIWNLYAIAWAIRKYDAARTQLTTQGELPGSEGV